MTLAICFPDVLMCWCAAALVTLLGQPKVLSRQGGSIPSVFASDSRGSGCERLPNPTPRMDEARVDASRHFYGAALTAYKPAPGL